MCSAVHDSTAVRDCAALDLEDEAFAIGNAASAAGDAALEEARVRPVLGIADRVKSGQCPGVPLSRTAMDLEFIQTMRFANQN